MKVAGMIAYASAWHGL